MEGKAKKERRKKKNKRKARGKRERRRGRAALRPSSKTRTEEKMDRLGSGMEVVMGQGNIVGIRARAKRVCNNESCPRRHGVESEKRGGGRRRERKETREERKVVDARQKPCGAFCGKQFIAAESLTRRREAAESLEY